MRVDEVIEGHEVEFDKVQDMKVALGVTILFSELISFY